MLKKADSGTTPSLSITDKLGQMGKLGTYSGLVEAVTSLFAAWSCLLFERNKPAIR